MVGSSLGEVNPTSREGNVGWGLGRQGRARKALPSKGKGKGWGQSCSFFPLTSLLGAPGIVPPTFLTPPPATDTRQAYRGEAGRPPASLSLSPEFHSHRVLPSFRLPHCLTL